MQGIKMVRFTIKEDILYWIEINTDRRSVLRAIEEGTVEYLGGFSQTSFNTGSPIWIYKITSEYDKVWVVAVYTNGAITYLRDVPWVYWVGGKSSNTLYCGDNPRKYALLRQQSYLKQHSKQTPSKNRTSHSREDNGSANNTPLDTTNTMSVCTRLRVGIKNLWKRFF